MGLFAAYAALVAFSTFDEQWAYFLTPSNWLHHADDYVASKLIMFVVSAVPTVYAGALFAIFSDREGRARDGLMIGSGRAIFSRLIPSRKDFPRTLLRVTPRIFAISRADMLAAAISFS
jgi:hypothetical protein